MQPPDIPILAWWLIVGVSIPFYLLTLVRWMPTREMKTHMILAPVPAAIICLGLHYDQGTSGRLLLALCAAALLGPGLGLAGSAKKLEAAGDGTPPFFTIARALITVFGLFWLAVWLNS